MTSPRPLAPPVTTPTLSSKLKLASVMANNFFSVAVALASIYAIFKLSSGV